jgi:hypothetical protein
MRKCAHRWNLQSCTKKLGYLRYFKYFSLCGEVNKSYTWIFTKLRFFCAKFSPNRVALLYGFCTYLHIYTVCSKYFRTNYSLRYVCDMYLSVLEILLVMPVKLKLSRLWISHGLSVILMHSEKKYFSKRNRIVISIFTAHNILTACQIASHLLTNSYGRHLFIHWTQP